MSGCRSWIVRPRGTVARPGYDPANSSLAELADDQQPTGGPQDRRAGVPRRHTTTAIGTRTGIATSSSPVYTLTPVAAVPAVRTKPRSVLRAADHTYYVVAGNASILVHNEDTLTQNQARLRAMRDAGLPTSLQPISQKYYSGGYGERGGYQYVYEYNGRRWLVTDDWNDLHADVPHDPHWEVGVAKPAVSVTASAGSESVAQGEGGVR